MEEKADFRWTIRLVARDLIVRKVIFAAELPNAAHPHTKIEGVPPVTANLSSAKMSSANLRRLAVPKLGDLGNCFGQPQYMHILPQ